MAYLGQDIEGGVLAKQTLAANDVLTSFELDHFSDANGLIVSVQGVVQEPGVAYTVSGNGDAGFNNTEIKFFSSAVAGKVQRLHGWAVNY